MLDRMFWSWVSNLKSVNIITNLVQQLVILLLSSFSTTLPQTVNVILLIVHENCKGPRKFMREETPRDSMRVGSQCKSFHLFALPKSKAKDKVCGRRCLWTWDGGLHWRSLIIRSKLSDLGPEVVVCTEDQLKTGVSFSFCLFCTQP